MYFEIVQEPSLLRIIVSGEWNAEQALNIVSGLKQVAEDRKQVRLLIDARGVSPNVSIADRHALASQLAELRSGVQRCAVVVATELMTTKTLEHAAMNRGLPLKTTDSIEEAYLWLGVPPPEQP